MLAVVSFVLGVIFFQAVKWFSARPKGYVRLGHNGFEERGVPERRSSSRRDDVSAVRSKYDYLFNYKPKKNSPKINLDDVEKSYRPEPRSESAAPRNTGELKNNYVDLSYLESNKRASAPETTMTSSPQIQPFFQAPINSEQGSANSPFAPSQANNSGPFFTPANPPAMAQPPNLEAPKQQKDEKERDWRPMGFFDE